MHILQIKQSLSSIKTPFLTVLKVVQNFCKMSENFQKNFEKISRIFGNFPKISRKFPEIAKNNVSGNFRKRCLGNFRKFPEISSEISSTPHP